MEQELMIKIAVACLAIFLLYHFFNQKREHKHYGDKIVYSPNEEKIRNTHTICPVLGVNTKVTACIHYPPLNKGFIVSTCCENCISTIQKSFKNADNEYSIKSEGSEYYIYHNNEKKQIVLECLPQNIEQIVDLVGTTLMGENNFIKADSFEGEKKGWIFKKGEEGLGYYKDN